MKRFLLLLIFAEFITGIYSQDFSNKGKEFWLAYPQHIDLTQSVMGIYITSDKNATGQIDVAGTLIPFTITAKQVTTKFLGSGAGFDGSNSIVHLTMQDGVKTNGAIKITSNVPVVVYAHIIKSARSAATLVLPTPVLGTEYVVPNHESSGMAGAGDANVGELTVVATQPNTVIEVKPTIAGKGGKPAGTAFQVTLPNAGDVYQFQGIATGDLSGTTVKSVSTGTGACKPIAVFSASTWSAFDCSGASGGDNLFQQLFPVRSWGKNFITAPFINRPYDIYRVFTKDTGTVVVLTESGVTQTLGGAQYNAAGKFYEFKTNEPTFITSNKPISVVQYIVSTTCKSGCTTQSSNIKCHADPEMVILNPLEQTLKDITFFSAHQNFVPSGQSNIDLHFVNIIIHQNFKNTVKIDGAAPKGTFVNIPATNYAYLQEDVTTSSATNPVHNITADTGFSAIVYGYGQVESYGYNGGTNVTDLYQYITIRNQYATVNFPSTCRFTPFHFSITLPYQPVKMDWDFYNTPALSPNTPVTNSSPVYDSSFVKDGKTLYVYKLPALYEFSQIGTYNVKVTVNNPTSDGCNGDQEIYYQVEVYEKPKANFAITSNGCTNVPVVFKDSSETSGRSIVKYMWDFGGGAKDSIANPTHSYTTGGSFPIHYSIITDVGCLADTIKTLTISEPPTAGFTVANPICEKRPIVFTDTSKANTGTIANWYWNMGNGHTYSFTSLPNPFAEVYDTTGTFNVKLVVTNSGGCKDSTASLTITTHALPHVGYVLPDVCLDDAFAQFTDTTTISDGTQNFFKYLWSFGDKNATPPGNADTSTLKNSIHKYSDTGIYKIQLTVTSKDFCKDSLQASFIVNGSTPKADFTVLNATKLCSSDSVRIQNTSTVDFGNVTKIEIYWDTAGNPGLVSTDNDPYPNKIYPHLYPSFTSQPNKTVYVKMYAYSGISCVSTKTIAVVLQQIPAIQFNHIPSICNNATPRNITQASETSGAAGSGSFSGSGITNAFAGTFNPTLLTAGTYTITYTFTTTGYGCKASDSNTITVLPTPQAKFGISSPACEKNNLTFSDSSVANAGSVIQWDWNFGDGNTTTLYNNAAFAHQYNTANTYTASLKITTDSGCQHSVNKIIVVHYLPHVYFGLPASVCLPDGKGTFLDSSTIPDFTQGSFSYHWNFGDVYDTISSSVKNPVHKFSDTAAKQIQLIVTSKDGCKDSLTRTLATIYPQPKAGFTVAPDTFACYGHTLSYTDKSNGISGAIKNYIWDLGFGYSSTAPNPVQPYNDTGTAIVSLQIINDKNCPSDTFKQIINIYPYPIIQLPASLTYLQGGLLTIVPAYYYGHNLTYLWTPNIAIVDDTVLNAQVHPNNDQRYHLTVTGIGGCADTASVNVIVLRVPDIPNAFSPNGDTKNDKWIIKNLDNYPGCTVQVFDRSGQLVFKSLGYSENRQWDGTMQGNGKPLPIGTYYYIIDPKNGLPIFSGSVTILR